MGYLDELRKQAATRKADEQAEQEQRAQREAFYREHMLPRLEACYSYLSQMVEHLNYVNPDIRVTYELKGYGLLPELKQGDYEVTVDSRNKMQHILLHFVCRGEDAIEFSVQGKKTINRCIDYLRGTGLAFQHRESMDSSHTVTDARFIVKNEVPITITFNADIENSVIVLNMRNMDDFIKRQFQFKPDELDEAFLDKLARFIVREDPDFMRLDIPAETREILQQKLREEQARREQELAAAEQAEVEEKAESAENGRLRQVFKPFSRSRD